MGAMLYLESGKWRLSAGGGSSGSRDLCPKNEAEYGPLF